MKEEFENPTGYWEYNGAYFVVLTDDAETSHLPVGAVLKDKNVCVPDGRIKQTIGGIQFYADNASFAWGYKFIRKIMDGSGQLIWQNREEAKTKKKLKRSEIPQCLFDLFRVEDAVKLEKKRGDEKRQVFRAKLRIGSAVFIKAFGSTHLNIEDPDALGRCCLRVSYDAHHKNLSAIPEMIDPEIPVCDVMMEIIVKFWELAKEAED